MTFVLRCPNCHAEHIAASPIAGRRVRCPACFEVVDAVDSGESAEGSTGSNSDTVVFGEEDMARESGEFNPYQDWLEIPAEDLPPNFYRLLNLPNFEPDSYVVSGAADRQIAKVNAASSDDEQADLKARLIDEIKRAKECLTDPEKKPTYDRRLHKQLKKEKQAEAVEAEAVEAEEAVEQPISAAAAAVAQTSDADTSDDTETADDSPAAAESVDAEVLEPAQMVEAPSPVMTPPPVIQPPAQLSADVGVRALMHVDEEDEDAADAFVDFSEDRTEFESEMDMTPMVDVTFLLLIFFMVTASFSLQKSIEQPVQKQDEPSTNVTQQEFEDNPDYVVVQIDEFNTFNVVAADFEEKAPSEQELLIMLRRARDGKGGRVPTKLLVAAHGDAAHGRVIMAMDAGTEVGMEQVQFTLAPESDF